MSLFDFGVWVRPAEFDWWWHHRLIAREIQDVIEGITPLLCIEAPPQHGKSEYTSRLGPAYAFGRNPDWKILGCSHTWDLAEEMTRDIKGIMDTDRYRAVFPGVRVGVGAGKKGKTRTRVDMFDIDKRAGMYKGAGIGGPIAGRRFNLGDVDDPIKDRAQANSRAYRETCWRWWSSVFRQRRARKAGIIVTSTRWHGEDLIGRIIRRAAENPKAPQPKVITLQAIATDKRVVGDPRQPGEPLWPWFRSLAELESERENDPQEFAAVFQQDPRAEGAVEWEDKLFGPDVWFDDWPADINLRIMCLDPSKGTDSKHGDYQAFVWYARTKDGTLWIDADMRRGGGTTWMIEHGVELARRFERESQGYIDAFGIETNQFQDLLVEPFTSVSEREGYVLPIYKIVNTLAKIVRIRRLTPEFTMKRVRFRHTPGCRLLVEQLRQFPVADHDDGPDALEMCRRLGMQLWNEKVNS